MNERRLAKKLKLPQFLDAHVDLERQFARQDRKFTEMGYESVADRGFVPSLDEQSRLMRQDIPSDLQSEELPQWAEQNNALLSERHAYFLLMQGRDVLQRAECRGKIVHFYGTQYKKHGVLYAPVLYGSGQSWIMRLDPVKGRRDAKDVVLRLAEFETV